MPYRPEAKFDDVRLPSFLFSFRDLSEPRPVYEGAFLEGRARL